MEMGRGPALCRRGHPVSVTCVCLQKLVAPAVRVCVPSFWSQRPITTEFQLLLPSSLPRPYHHKKE